MGTYKSIKKQVLKKVKPKVVKQFLVFVEEECPYLIGIKRGVKLSRRSWQHNIRVVRSLGGTWGKQLVELGTLSEWQETAKYVLRPKKLNEVLLWIDTTDIPLVADIASFEMPREDAFTFGGGTLPSGMLPTILFYAARNSFKGVKIFASIPIPLTGKRKYPGQGEAKLTKKEEVYNRQVARLRARVEQSFAMMGNIFASVRKPWAGTVSELDDTIFWVVGLWNAWYK